MPTARAALLYFLLACAIAVALAVVIAKPVPIVRTVVVAGVLPPPRTIDLDTMYGVASWYGVPFHGRRTASGTIYDMGGYSVAHKTVPMGTFVVIKNLDNGRWCVAVVNDRGPYIKGRDWDVSAAVAGRLGMVYRGRARVKVRIIDGY